MNNIKDKIGEKNLKNNSVRHIYKMLKKKHVKVNIIKRKVRNGVI